MQSTQTKCVGAVPACPPERPRNGVSIAKIRELGIRKLLKKLVISLLFCNFIVVNQQLIKQI